MIAIILDVKPPIIDIGSTGAQRQRKQAGASCADQQRVPGFDDDRRTTCDAC